MPSNGARAAIATQNSSRVYFDMGVHLLWVIIIPGQSRDVQSNFGVQEYFDMRVHWPWVIPGRSGDVQSNFSV